MAGAYKLEDFLFACASGTSAAYVSEGAMVTARAEFGLVNQRQALCFLAAFAPDQYRLQDSSPWRNCHPSFCDAYIVSDGSIDGYVSFGKPPKSTKWVIKSLKINRRLGR